MKPWCCWGDVSGLPQVIMPTYHDGQYQLLGSMTPALCPHATPAAVVASLIPLPPQDVGRFRILGATLAQMPGWCSDLKYAAALGTSVWHLWRPSTCRILAVKAAVGGRPLWVAASTHEGEGVCGEGEEG
jgi:hypothetical protein